MNSVEAMGRLRNAAFQIGEIVGLVEASDPCMELIQRIRLVQNELRQVHDGLLVSHLAHCVDAARRREDCETLMDEIRDAYRCMQKF